MKKHLLFNQSFGTEGSPNQTDETLTRENRIGLMSYLRRTLMLLFAVLVMSIGQAWGTDYNLISGDALNTTNFVAAGSFTKQSSGVSISGTKYAYYTTSGNQNTANVSSANTPGKVLQYHCQTTATTIVISRYNSSSSSVSYYHNIIAEGATGDLSNATEHACAGYSNVNDTIVANGFTNRTIYIYLKTSSSSIKFLNVKAIESGTALATAGEAGYSFNFNKGRLIAVKNADGSVPNEGLTFHLGNGNYSCYDTDNAYFATSGTDYIKFSTGASPVKLEVTTNATAAYSVNKVKGYNADSAATSPTKDQATSFNLDANSTYYINPNGANIKLTCIEFKVAAATKDYTVTAVSSNDTYGTVSAGASSLDEGETTTITATPATGYQVTNWAVSGTGASISPNGASNSNTTTLTMGTANATVTATFGPKSYTVTLSNQEADAAGTESVTTTYNSNTNLTSAITKPTKDGKVFAGYFTAANGGGVQLIDAAGNWIASAGGGSTYLDGSKNWKNDGNLTLYACWMEYASTFDIKAYVQSNLSSGSTTKTFTILGTNKLLYSLSGNTELDNSSDASNAYDGLKFKNSGDYILFLVQANSSLKLYFGYTDTKPKISINGGAESNVDVSSTGSKTADQEVDFGSETYDRLIKIRTVTSNAVVLQKISITSSCTAPTAVYVTQTAGSADMVAGESFTLSAATSTGVEEGATYQWYRNSTEVGTNLPTYTVPSCTKVDAGTYWCKITNPCSSDAHTTNVTGFGIKVWQVLLCESSSWNDYDLTSTGTNTGEVTRQLTPGTYYIKLTHNNGVDFGVNSDETISEISATTPSAWTLYNGQNKIKVTVTTAGDYTFGVDYTSADYPKLSVTYPPSTISSCDKIYFCPTVNSIATGSARFSIYFFNATESGWANCYLVSGTDFADDAKYVAYAPATTNGWTKMIVVRDDVYASSFDGIWNQSQDITYNGYNYIVGTGYSDSKITTNLNSFYSSTTPAMSESEYCVIVGGTTTASTNLPSSAVTYISSDEAKATVGSTTGVITGVAAGTATITAKVGTCTVGTATVTVYAAPSVALSSSSVTYGASAPTLTPSNFATITGYSSSTTGTATINGSGVISIVAAGTTTFTVTGTDQCGNSVNVTTGTFTVNQATPTKYDFSVNKTVLCGEETATLTLAGSQSGVTYELREDSSTPIADTEKTGTGSALTWTGLGAGNYVVYAVETANYEERQMNSSKITISNGTATSITTQPTNQEVTVGEEATLTVVAAGTSLSYQWKESATEDGTYSNVASGGTSASYSVTPAAAGTKWYKCVVTGTCGTETTAARKIVANAAATCSGDPTALEANTVYQAANMLSNCAAAISGTGQQIYGLSNNGKFYIVGTTNDNNGSTGTVEIKNETNNDIGGDTDADFSSVAYLKMAGSQSHHSIKFVVPSAGTLTVWGYTKKGESNGDVQIKPQDGDAVTLITHDKDNNIKASASTSVTAGTYYLLSNGGGAAVYGIKFVAAVACTTAPTVTEGSNSSVGSTTATVSCAGGISVLGTGGCTISSYGFVLGTSENPTLSNTVHQVGTSYASTGTSFSKDLTGLTAETTYYVRPYATNGYGTAYGTQTSFTTEAAAATYTVTYNAQGGSVTPSSETVSTATLPTPTKSGYTFDGWYTSGGSKITGTYNPTADITLYAQWRENCVGTATTLEDINFKDAAWSDKTFNQGNTNDEDEINGVYFWAKDATKHFSLEDNTSNGLTFPNNNMSSGTYYFCIPITGINSSNKQITVTLKHGYSSAQAEYKWAYVDGRTSFSDGNTGGSGGTKVQDASKASTEITFTLNNSGKGLTNTAGHLFIGRSSSSYTNIYGVTVTTPGAAGTCYYVTYNGNGATGGYTTDEAAYASGDNATAATNSFTKTGYTFGGWATSKANADAGTKTYDAGADIPISGNITLYAIWQAAGYTLAWNSNGGSALSGTYSSGSFADGATITAPNDPTRANYTFDSWNTAADGSGNAYTGTMPAANTTYYAVWKNTLTLKRGSQGSESDKSPTVFLGGSSLNGFSAHKAAGYTLQGYYTAATGGTKVLNADGSFAASNIARFVTSGKWSRTTGDTILVAQWESSYLLKWNLQLNKAEDAISTTSKESATARITTASMTNLTNNGGLTITSSKKSDLTSLIETPIDLSGAESKYMSVSFDVTAGYQLLPSAVKVIVQPVGDGENKYAKLILKDENSHSISTVVECEGTEKGKKTTVTLSNAGGTVFTGTVTLKILVYNKSGASTTNNCYRLGSPIQIDGAIEAACDLPSYEGLEYDQTEYTVGVDEASAIRVTGGSADTYQWKWNSTNDRSTGMEVGTNYASYTPLITNDEVGTRYYWCELTNDDCDGVVKTPAVAVTVSSAVTATTVTWSDPVNEPNYGGGGYVIRATVDQTGWGGTLGESNLVAPAGIHITNVDTGTDDDKKYIEATFDVTTAFDRDENEVIVFGLTHDAVTGYSAISVTDTIDYDACSGGEDGSAAVALTSAIHDEGSGNAPRYWFETSGVGRVFGINYGKATLSTSSDATFSSDGYEYVASSTSQRWVFQPYVEGVTKIRIYIKSATNTLKVSSIGKNASWQEQSSKYSNIAVDTIIYSNGKTTGLDNNQKGYAEIQFSSALTKNNYYMITMSSSSTYIYGITLYSESVGDGGNLATSLTFANTGPIDADASTANFQNIASKSGENSNTLGTITYSSNNDAATVNATTGEVSIHAKGTAQVVTITATLSASGCYQGATATYTINVAADVCGEPSGSIELTSGSATKCSGESVILTMTGFTSGATVEWYNGDTKVNDASGYTIVTSGSTSTLTTSNDGTYSAIAKVDGGCASGAGRTNSITISNISVDASATKIVDKWYVKNGRRTPDIALWSLDEGTHLNTVTITRDDAGVSAIGLTASDFKELDGVVYLSGKEPSANETGADVNYTLTLTVEDACGSTTPLSDADKKIQLTHQKNTDKHVLAFVVNGTEKGDWTAGLTAAQTTKVGLYNEIATNFDVLATNIYSTDNEQKLKEYYSQFDILCITDYPNTQTKGANSKSYVDAIGSLIDIRPILTMEAFVSKLENWKVKGISGNPKSPSTRQYTMLLQCKDHEIFAGTKLTTIGEGDETMYRVSMVDSTKEDYATLDATYGAILPHKEKESKKGAGDAEYNYGGKPALQGFTFTQEMSDNDLLPIGLIDDGAGNPLQVGIERQHNMEARLMVLGINSYAMERLTDDGQKVVVNALKYLMKKNSEDIADCSNTFVGGDDEEDASTRDNWNVASHWSGNAVPDRTQKVRIVAPCVIPSGEKPHVTGVVIAPSGKYNHGANTANGSLTIAAGGALIVDGKVEAATAPLYTETRATAPADLTIGSTETNGNGTLIFDNEDGSTQAIVEYYSKATTDEASSWSWQYMAVPFNDNSSAYRNYYDSYLYRWKEDCTGWEVVPNRGEVYPWVGYTITQEGNKTYTMDGTLVETGEMEFTVPAGKNLVLGNSWTAPIQVKQFTDDDFENMSKNVYLFNTGYDEDGTGTFDKADGRYEGGTYVTIPIHSSTYTGDSLISSLQAFIVYAKADEGGGTFTLDYDRHVRPARSSDKVNAGPMHAPKRGGAIDDKPAVLKVWASGSRYDDRLVVLERGDFSTGLDEGWDGNKRVAGNSSPLIFAVTDNGREAVSAIPTMEGTLIGFWAGEDNEYTLHFEYDEEDELYLLDLDNNTYTPVNSNSTYVFTVPDKKAHNRFILTRNAPDPVATGVEETQASEKPEAKAIKFLKDEKVFIFVNGKLYDATGKIVK